MNLSVYIGKRYLRATRGKGFISFISGISVLGIMVGIIALIVVLSVMNGVTSEVREKILSMTAHIKLVPDSSVFYYRNLPENERQKQQQGVIDVITQNKAVIAYAPFIESQALYRLPYASSGAGYEGILVKGIDPNEELAVSETLAHNKQALDTLKAGAFNVVIGQQLANSMQLSVGDSFSIILPDVNQTVMGAMPRSKRLTISGVFESGHYLYDRNLILVHLKDARKLFPRNSLLLSYQLKIKDPFIAKNISEQLDPHVAGYGYYASDWTSQNKSYFDAVKTEKAAMFFILMIIVMVAAFNILSTLVMVVTDKSRDIAILRTLGAAPRLIMHVFIIQGTMLGVLGTLFGVVFGVLIAHQVPHIMALLKTYFNVSLPPELYYISAIKPRLDTGVIVLIAGVSLLLSFLATLYPAYKAATLHPARALAYE